ncbi:Pr6Pr family membrane protein [Algoriphagus terrigena]|uniref:Pr6Pr family membrane protein n=1 Tax=Algoriphagus terrigena TaxID=344884 RepID=UPI0003F63E5A|nr:Pr6Pr family membrane protein [Algoriphagus terrigena]
MNKLTLALIFILECFALPIQYFLLLDGTELSIVEATVRFFSYFTILTNSLVAICCGFLLLPSAIKPNQFFSKNTTLTAITVYILIVGLVFNIILRPTVNLMGLHLLVSEIFHTLVPLLFLFFWIRFVPKHALPWNSLPKWMIYPLVYVLYTLIHGIYSGFYPYPFIDAGKLGFSTAMTNGLVVLLAFVILSALLIAVGKLKIKEKASDRSVS